MRVLVVTNLVPDEGAPQRGRWVRDQVAEVRARGVEVEEFGFPRGRSNYLPATRRLRALLHRERYDLVHAHYGLAGWVARAAGARPLLVTFHGTDIVRISDGLIVEYWLNADTLDLMTQLQVGAS